MGYHWYYWFNHVINHPQLVGLSLAFPHDSHMTFWWPGTFGKVKLGRHILTGERVAVKVLEKLGADDPWLCDDYCVILYVMIMWWLGDDYVMIAWLLRDDYVTITWWLHDDYVMMMWWIQSHHTINGDLWNRMECFFWGGSKGTMIISGDIPSKEITRKGEGG